MRRLSGTWDFLKEDDAVVICYICNKTYSVFLSIISGHWKDSHGYNHNHSKFARRVMR